MIRIILSILMVLVGSAVIYAAKTLLTLPTDDACMAVNPWMIIFAASAGGVMIGAGLTTLRGRA